MSNVVSDADELSDLQWSDLPTEEVAPQPSYVTEVPVDVLREEYVTVAAADLQHVREETFARAPGFGDHIVDFVASVLDRLIGRPLGFLLSNWLTIVLSGAVLVAFAYGADYVMDLVARQFGVIRD